MADEKATIDELTRELAQKAAEARVLQQVSADINATLELTEIFDIVLHTMDELFGFSHALVLLLDEGGEELTVTASRGYEGRGIGAKVKVGVGPIGVVAKRRRVMRVNNIGAQRSYAAAVRKRMEEAGEGERLGEAAELPGLPQAECLIAIPMMVKDSLVGVFAVESAQASAFGERDEVLAAIVANQAASAIHNAQLYRSEALRRAELADAHVRLQRLAEGLEDRVRERTAELENALRELRDTQARLLQSGKMAALGQLVAGVAHELNTPLGSISSNAQLALRALGMVKQSIEADKLTGQTKLHRAIQALEQACETELVASERVAAIVRSLRNFARIDEAEHKRADLHEGIDSTLLMLRHQLRGIEVKRDFGELPQVLCYPNQLNQVVMNLLVNAQQAIAGEGGEGEGTITIATRHEGSDVTIRVSDTGRGIAPAQLERIFDPGFTTKGVGVGTGLGLSICYQIIELHRGRIEVASEIGKGASFTVRVPVDGAPP